MDVKQALSSELELSRRELRAIESEIQRLTDARFDKLLHIGKTQQDYDRLRFNIPTPSAASKQFECDRENQAVGND